MAKYEKVQGKCSCCERHAEEFNYLNNFAKCSGQVTLATVFAFPRQVTQSSIADLSRETQAGEATVIRFCRTLGYKGFQDFKMDLPLNLPLLSLMTVVLYWMPKLANPTMPTPLV